MIMRTAVKSSQPDAAEQGNWPKIGEISNRSGIGIEVLHFNERNGLLDQLARTNDDYRLYSPDVLERLEFKIEGLLTWIVGDLDAADQDHD